MPNVLFTITYSIQPELRDRYLALVKEVREHMTSVAGKDYAVFEIKGRPNHFTEIYRLRSVEEFEAMDDNQDEKTEELVSRLSQCIDDKGMKYSTLIEAL
jgi:hypothetical protein